MGHSKIVLLQVSKNMEETPLKTPINIRRASKSGVGLKVWTLRL